MFDLLKASIKTILKESMVQELTEMPLQLFLNSNPPLFLRVSTNLIMAIKRAHFSLISK